MSRAKRLCAIKNTVRLHAVSADQREELVRMLKSGAEQYGYQGQVWTRARVRELIQRQFGVKYHLSYIGKLLKKLGWSWQKPRLKAIQRNEAEVREWCEVRWPAIKKKLLKKRGK